MPPTDRRDFLKTTLAFAALAPGTVVATAAGLGQATPPANVEHHGRLGGSSADGSPHTGLLFSQVGYPTGTPVRVVVRAPARDSLAAGATCTLTPMAMGDAPDASATTHRATLMPFGERWASHWWTADFGEDIPAGEYAVAVENAGRTPLRATGLTVADDVLWRETYDWATVEMLMRRSYFTNVGAGWQDAGALWAESPAQSAMLICLCDVAQSGLPEITPEFLTRLHAQIVIGADYLVLCADKAVELGHPVGAQSHDVIKHEAYVLPNDTMKAVVALYRSVESLPAEGFAEKRARYERTAKASLDYLLTAARPIGDQGMSKLQRGLPEDTAIPKDEWPTRDLMFLCWATLEAVKAGDDDYLPACIAYARQLSERQIPRAEAIEGYYGNFREYASMAHAEPLWTHCINPAQELRFGTDIGAIFANYLVPLFELIERYPTHADAAGWRQTLRNYAEGYLIPTCALNPFSLVPNAVYAGQGPVWFAGPFHGSNAIYGYTAAFASRMYGLWPDARLRDIALGNLQWIAGLNAGITRENIKMGSVIYSADIPEDVALPASMICRVGKRWAGTWFQTRGVVCNGFSVGPQFELVIEPTIANDGPTSFTDEDWIPHSAGFLTGLMQYKRVFA